MKLLFTLSFLLIGIQQSLAVTCVKEKGYCVKEQNRDQNHGQMKLDSIDGATDAAQAACLEKCKKTIGATGCESIWSQGNRGCYIHTEYVEKGNGVRNHVCWVFSKCSGPVTPNTTQEIYGAPVQAESDPNIRVFTEAILGYSINRQFGEAKTCTDGIVGFRVKLRKINDEDIRINGIEMECKDGSKHVQESTHSTAGEWQTDVAKCGGGSVVTGIKYKEFRHRGGRQLLIECSDGNEHGPIGHDDDFAVWTANLFSGCPTTAKLCGFQGEEGYNEIGRFKVLCCHSRQLQSSVGNLLAMGNEVCIGSRNDNFGFFKAPQTGFLTELYMQYVDGHLNCLKSDPNTMSRFGCEYKYIKRSFGILVTKTDTNVIVPDVIDHQAGDHNSPFYFVPERNGFDADNFTIRAVNPTYVNKNDEIRLWYGEDLYNRHEHDNSDSVVCVNVWGKML